MDEFQTSFGTTYAVGVVGMRCNTEPENVISRTVESADGIVWGQPAFRGSDDHGCVVGAAFAATAVGAADAGNAGAGAISAAPAVASPALPGAYKVVHTSAGATAAFNVYDPNGVFVGNGVTGTEFVGGGLTFTVTDPGTDPAVGDSYTVTVTYTANAGLLGFVVMDPSVPAIAATPDKIPQNFTASIMNEGVLWVQAGAGGVVDGAQAYWNPATGKYTAATGILLPGCYYDTTAAADALVRLAIRKRIAN